MIDTTLPIHNVLSELIDSIEVHKSVVLQAETGAGKSTVVPLELLKAKFLNNQRIIMLEPRRMAARALATYMASCLGDTVGNTVGYQVKGEKKISTATKLEIITEGILINRLKSNPELDGVGLIIFDEFHERSTNADLSLMLTLEIQQILREDLRILVMSATLDTALLSRYLGSAPVVFCKGRSHPVSVEYRKTDKNQLPKAVCSAIQDAAENNGGHILVFLPGIAEINRCMSMFKECFNSQSVFSILPLHGSLTLKQQEEAIAKSTTGNTRKIIFSTNIAETSLTIEGITFVIDSGLEKLLQYSPTSGMSELKLTKISKASAEQRKGRAGRLMAGQCIRLWSESEHSALKEYQIEEIINADVADLVLQLASCGHIAYDEINWLTPPPRAHFDSTQDLLISLELLEESGRISELGKQASNLPVHPRLGRMILGANTPQEKDIACIIAAILTEKNFIGGEGNTDLLTRINTIVEYKSGSVNNYVKQHVIKNVLKVIVDLKKVIQHKTSFLDCASVTNISAYLLLLAFPERLAKRRLSTSAKYKLANGKGVYLHEADPLCKNEFIVVSECDAQKMEGRVFSAIGLDLEVLRPKIQLKFVQETQYVMSANKFELSARILTKYGSLTIDETKSSNIPQEILFKHAKSILKQNEKMLLTWTNECEIWLTRVVWLGARVKGFPELTREQILGSADEWLFPYITNIKTLSQFKKVKVFPLLRSILTYDETKTLDREAPSIYITPSKKELQIEYKSAEPPTVSVILQEMFGELKSPKLASSSTSLRFKLLSPARRPIQITSDLEGFWTGSYTAVAKEMRTKYPKHRWPEDPLNEKAGQSFKRR